MNDIINTLAGGESATPAKKIAVWATFGTAIALILVIAILVISSVALAIKDANAPKLEDDAMDGGDGNAPATSVKIEYTALSGIADLKAKMDTTLVKVSDGRTKMEGANNFYYAKNDSDGIDKLSKNAMKALDGMLVAFYKANTKTIFTDTTVEEGDKACNIPLIKNTDTTGTKFTLTDYSDNALSKNPIYNWIFENANSYGFVCDKATGDFRYVGVGIAKYVKTGNFDSFLDTVRTKTAEAPMTVSTGYKAYYVAENATDVKVPSELPYEIFADGMDGYIVVVKTSK